jgi:RNA polymerase sigma-70 factor (ECF subfamily)
MARLIQGETAVFDLLVERYQQRAYGIAYQMVGHSEDARDLSQEAFIRVYEGAASFRGESRFYTWFYRILVNLCLDHLRRQSFRGKILGFFSGGRTEEEEERGEARLEEERGWADPDRNLADREFRRALQGALEELSPKQRAVFLLRNNHELSIQEIAAVLKTSEGTVKTHLFRAIRSLRERLSVFQEGEEK